MITNLNKQRKKKYYQNKKDRLEKIKKWKI